MIARLLSRPWVHTILILVALIWMLPSVGLLVTSFRPLPDVIRHGWWSLHPFNFTVDNYQRVLTKQIGAVQGVSQYFLNSLMITVPATIIPLLVAALAAYAFAWVRFKGRDLLFVFVVALLVVPIEMSLIPLVQLLRDVGLIGTYPSLWLVHTAFGLPFAIFLLRNFFVTIPSELLDAARIDGASELKIFWRIVVPLSRAAFASLAIFQFVWVWNDLLIALVLMTDPKKQPLTVGITKLLSTFGNEWDLLSAAAFVSMSLPLMVFLFMQRYFVRGLMAGFGK